jgi:Family of unknown function (DUF6504)
VEVWLINGRPARFVWRERLYTVLSIIERPPAAPPAAAEREVAPEHEAAPGSEAAAERGAAAEHEAEASRARHPSAGHGGAGRHSDRTEWQCWLVTAAPGRNVPRATYRLCRDPEADRWLLTRNGR